MNLFGFLLIILVIVFQITLFLGVLWLISRFAVRTFGSAEFRKVMTVLLIGTGGVGLLTAICACIYSCYFIASAQRAGGTITEMRESKDKDGGVTYAPTFVFHDSGGTEHQIKVQLASTPAPYRVGDTVSILYQPNDPESARIDSFWYHWFWTVLGGLTGVVCTLFGFACIHWLRWSEHMKSALSRSKPGRFIRTALHF